MVSILVLTALVTECFNVFGCVNHICLFGLVLGMLCGPSHLRFKDLWVMTDVM